MTNFFSGYDNWKLASPEDEERETECDCCGEMKVGCVDIVYSGMDTHACPKCRDAEEDCDEAADRGDWEFHQRNDR